MCPAGRPLLAIVGLVLGTVGLMVAQAPVVTQIPEGARVVIAPMGGFETYFAAAVREKNVPITLTLDKDSAQFFIVSTDTEWQGFVYGSAAHANWSESGGTYSSGSAASSTRGLEASICSSTRQPKMSFGPMRCTKVAMGAYFSARWRPVANSQSQKPVQSILRNSSRRERSAKQTEANRRELVLRRQAGKLHRKEVPRVAQTRLLLLPRNHNCLLVRLQWQ
jgi:hypothetical protein